MMIKSSRKKRTLTVTMSTREAMVLRDAVEVVRPDDPTDQEIAHTAERSLTGAIAYALGEDPDFTAED